MAKSTSTSVPHPEVRPRPVDEVLTSSHRELRSSTRKRNADQAAESEGGEGVNSGSLDSSYPEAPTDAEEISRAHNTKQQKRVRKSVSANSQASWKKGLQERLKRLESEKKILEGSLKSVTRESVLNARRGAKGVWDQAKIETEFKNLKRDVKNWVKKYGTTKKLSTFSDGVKRDVLSACASDCYQKVFAEEDFDLIQELPKGAQLLLEGFLYAYSIYYLIARPFLFVDAVLQEHSRPNSAILSFGNYETVFEEFAHSLAECEAFPDQGQRWTASMLQSLKRLIIPDPSDDIKSHKKVEKASIDSFRIYELGISHLANEFIVHREAVRHLLDNPTLKKDRDVRRDHLKMIYRKFRELAYHMWCQPSTILYYYEMDLFDPEFMELDSTAVQARQDLGMDIMKGSKVLVRLCPRIRGEIVDPVNSNERRKVDFLHQKVWTIDCQTHGQWKASQKEFSSDESEKTGHTLPIVQEGSQEMMTGYASVENQSVSEAQVPESEDDNVTTWSPPDANSDTGHDLRGVQELIQSSTPDSEITHSRVSPHTNDATKHDDSDAMEED